MKYTKSFITELIQFTFTSHNTNFRVKEVARRPKNAEPVDPKRIKAFALFFKRYMSISTIVVASLPIPVTLLNVIPTFSAHTKLLSVYTPLFCFLTLGFIFYCRHSLARIMFYDTKSLLSHRIVNALPLVFIVASIIFVISYHTLLNYTLTVKTGMSFKETNEFVPVEYIPYSPILMLTYIAIFVTAEAAFIMMAIKEYLQDLVGLSEMDLIAGLRKEEA